MPSERQAARLQTLMARLLAERGEPHDSRRLQIRTEGDTEVDTREYYLYEAMDADESTANRMLRDGDRWIPVFVQYIPLGASASSAERELRRLMTRSVPSAIEVEAR